MGIHKKISNAGRLLLLGACAALVGSIAAQPPRSQVIDVREHGVPAYKPGDPSTLAAATIQALMKDYPEATLYFAAGSYLLAVEDPGKDGLVIGPQFHGSLHFANGAKLVCSATPKTVGACVHILSASHVSTDHLDISYIDQALLPRDRAAAKGYALLVDDSRNITLTATTIEDSPGACFWASNNVDLTVHDLHVTRCAADGVHFENDNKVDLQDMWSSHTLDDGLAFTSVARNNPNCGAAARGIHIEDSAARGIAVPGGCDIAVAGFSIERTGVSGILVNTDDAFHMRRPANVSFRDGVIRNAGALSSSSGGGNRFGIEVSAADHVSFDHVQVIASASRGFDVSHGATDVSLTDSSIQDAGDNGINLIGASNILLTRDLVENASGYGAYLAGVSGFRGSQLTLVDVSTRKSSENLHRAFWVDSPRGSVSLESLKIIDNQPVATGYIVGCSDLARQSFSMTGLRSSIRVGSLKIECAGSIAQSAF